MVDSHDSAWRQLRWCWVEVLLRCICSILFARPLTHARREEVRLVLLEKSLYTESVDQSDTPVHWVVQMDSLLLDRNLNLRLLDADARELLLHHWLRFRFARAGRAKNFLCLLICIGLCEATYNFVVLRRLGRGRQRFSNAFLVELVCFHCSRRADRNWRLFMPVRLGCWLILHLIAASRPIQACVGLLGAGW